MDKTAGRKRGRGGFAAAIGIRPTARGRESSTLSLPSAVSEPQAFHPFPPPPQASRTVKTPASISKQPLPGHPFLPFVVLSETCFIREHSPLWT